MSFSVSPDFAPFAMPVAAQTHQRATGHERAHDDANRRHQRHPHARTPLSAAPANPSPDPNAPLPLGTLIDVKA